MPDWHRVLLEQSYDDMIWGKRNAPAPQGFMSHRQAVGRTHRGRMTVTQARQYLGHSADFMIVDDPYEAKKVDVTVGGGGFKIGRTELTLDDETVRMHADKVTRALEAELLRFATPNCRCTVLNP